MTASPDRDQAAVILTPDQRVRVFISSTLEELAAERVAAQRAIRRLHLIPVFYESGARPYPPRSMYQAYLAQSQVFIGIYWQRYGWVAPGMNISGLEDEYQLAAGKPMLLYLKRPAPDQEPRLAAMIDSIRATGTVSYRAFGTPRELERLLTDDLAVLLSESFARAAISMDSQRASPAEPGKPEEEELPAGTVTFLLTDIEGSTRLWETAPEAMERALERHNRLLTGVIEEHSGIVVTSRGEGDSFFAVFPSAVAAIQAAGAGQLAMNQEAWPAGASLRVRMGLHTSEARVPGSDQLDHAPINRCARVKAAAHGGQVLVTKTTHDLVEGRLGSGFGLMRLGEFRLRDLAEPVLIYQLTHADLPPDFPPIRTPAERTSNLPMQVNSFIGRHRELSEVRALIASSRLVTLTGAGGCGKTRLSLQVAAGLFDEAGDGVWLVELAAVTRQDAVAPAICEALGITGQPGRPALETLLDAIAPQDMLIVLDNCEHLIGACAKTAEAILQRCPRMRLLGTSREPLSIPGETIYRVPSLSLPGPGDTGSSAASSDAVALFIERARAQGTSLSVDEQTGPLLASICTQLDGLPLAIELAAARLRSLSLIGLHDRLDQRFRLLTGGSRTAVERQQTLRATVDWSYSLLSGTEQVLLRRLSVFADSFDLDAAEAVCGFSDIEAFDVTDLLGSLVDKSLVVAEPSGDTLRYRLLETIRQFAAEQLAEADDEDAAVRAAHCAHYLSVAETAAPHLSGPEQGKWFARLDTDQVDLWRAAEHAARDPDDVEELLRFGAALRRYWRARSREQEAAALLMPVLDRPEARAHPELFATALLTAAFFAARRVDLAIARQLGEQSVELARQLDTDRPLIESLATLSYVCYLAGAPEQGLPVGQEAVERARQLGDDVLLGESLAAYLLCDALIDPTHARSLIAEAIACTQRSGDHLFAYFLTNYAGAQALRGGDIPAARAYLQQAAQAMREFGDEGLGVTIHMGWVLRQDSDHDGARSTFEAALRMSRRNGDRFGIAYTCLGLGCLAADTGDWHRAAVLHGAAQNLLGPTGQSWEEPEAHYRQDSLDQIRTHLGQVHLERAYAKGIALSFDEALELASGRPPA